jgi:hypothetical protein
MRRQYLCNVLHMQIHHLSLHYKTSDCDALPNMMQDDRDTIQGLMRDPANTELVFNIGFEPIDESEEVFETDYQHALG